MQANFTDLLGKTLISVRKSEDEIIFTCSDGSVYQQCHEQDCCENVSIEEVIGDFDDLLNQPLLDVREEISHDEDVRDGMYNESHTWTFYILRTEKGSVTIRWLGSSNGYYSESVDFYQITPPTEVTK